MSYDVMSYDVMCVYISFLYQPYPLVAPPPNAGHAPLQHTQSAPLPKIVPAGDPLCRVVLMDGTQIVIQQDDEFL